MNAAYLLKGLEKDLVSLVEEVKELREATKSEAWLVQPSPEKWSGAQVIEHLNSYNRYYLPKIQLAILKAKNKHQVAKSAFKSGWLGAYFTRMMKPTAQGTVAHKMQAPKDHRPVVNLDIDKVMAEFERQENLLSELILEAAGVDLDVRVPIS